MPTYANRCQSCKHEFDTFQKMSDKPITVCPQCDGDVVRLIGAGCPPIFKGSGFYCNDYPEKGR